MAKDLDSIHAQSRGTGGTQQKQMAGALDQTAALKGFVDEIKDGSIGVRFYQSNLGKMKVEHFTLPSELLSGFCNSLVEEL